MSSEMSGSESDSFLSADEEYPSSPNSRKSSPLKKGRDKLSSRKDTKKSDDNKTIVTQKHEIVDEKEVIKSAKSAEISEVVKDNTAEADGWDDFDDWEDDGDVKDGANVATVSASSKSISAKADTQSTFATSESQTNENLRHNTSSSYDTFPVLNTLEGNRSRNNVQMFPLEGDSKQNASQTTLKSDTSWGGWKPWGGVVSFLSNATEGVTTLTSQVGHGLASVLENSIGVPEPEEMARLRLEEDKKKKQIAGDQGNDASTEKVLEKKDSKDDLIMSSVGNLLTGVTQIGSKVITGGLDTLEGIGKKTMTILQENDPLLLNKRKLLGLDSDKPVLSQMLREAKEKSEETEKNLKQIQKNAYKKQLHFEMLFDHYHGLVHLEALEMLSKQSSLKLQSLLEPLTGKALVEMQETLNEVKELCDLGDLDSDDNDGSCDIDELKEKLTAATEDLGVNVDFTELIKCWEDNLTACKDTEHLEPQEIYNKALRCLAETTALIVNKMHKLAELLLIKDHHSTANEADSLVQMTTVFCWHLHAVANYFGAKLNSHERTEETSSLITSIFLEESNSSSYVKSAFQLFIPILQIGAA